MNPIDGETSERRGLQLRHGKDRFRASLFPFNDVVDLEDCRLSLDTQVFQNRHELRAEGLEFSWTFEDVYHLQALLVAIADVVHLSVGYSFTDFCQSTDDLIVFRCSCPLHIKHRDDCHVFLLWNGSPLRAADSGK